MERIKAARDYLRTWLDRHRKASDLVPAVQEAIDQLDWGVRALEDRPTEAINVSTSQLDAEAELTYERIVAAVPMMPAYDRQITFQLYAASTCSASAVLTHATDIGDLGTPAAVAYTAEKVDAYRDLQERHQRPARVMALITELFTPSEVQRFDSAQTAYQQWNAGVGARTAAALELRTLLDGVQGRLFERARGATKENMTWQAMATRLFASPGTEGSRDEMLRQESVRSCLLDDLSIIAKQREGDRRRDLHSVWMRTLDHLFVVLNLLKSQAA